MAALVRLRDYFEKH